MLKRFFPSESSRYKHIQNLFKRINTDIIDRLEIFFPMWIMFAFQHYLIKSYDIVIFRGMDIDLNRYYLFSMITEDWIGVVNILLHSLLFLWLMNRFESFGPFRSVKIDCQTNFLLFLTIYCIATKKSFNIVSSCAWQSAKHNKNHNRKRISIRKSQFTINY